MKTKRPARSLESYTLPDAAELPPFALCYRDGNNGRPLYVSHLPGEDGKDWGYTAKPEGTPNRYDDTPARLDVAKPLNRYWQRRFRADCRRVGATYHAIPCRSEDNPHVQAGWPTVSAQGGAK